MKVDVCVCTHRRETIVDTIESLGEQQLPEGVSLRVIVSDNDDVPSAKERVEQAAEKFGVAIKYVHAPKHNISIARNAALDAVDADWVAIMDDDEVASPTWLKTHLQKANDEGLDVVFGSAIARYPYDAPQWIVARDYHTSHPETRNGEVQTGATNNVLMRITSKHIQGRRFLEEKGKSGGEDTAFFFDVWRSGGKLGISKDALVYEDVNPARLNFAWLRRRNFRSGMSYGRSSIPQNAIFKRLQLAALATVKVTYCFVRALTTLFSKEHRNFWLLRGVFHSGVVFAFMGKEPEIYGV